MLIPFISRSENLIVGQQVDDDDDDDDETNSERIQIGNAGVGVQLAHGFQKRMEMR